MPKKQIFLLPTGLLRPPFQKEVWKGDKKIVQGEEYLCIMVPLRSAKSKRLL